MATGKKEGDANSIISGDSAQVTNKKLEALTNENDSTVGSSSYLIKKAIEELGQLPNIRTDAISLIQKEVNNGSYCRDEVKIAKRVIDDHIKSTM